MPSSAHTSELIFFTARSWPSLSLALNPVPRVPRAEHQPHQPRPAVELGAHLLVPPREREGAPRAVLRPRPAEPRQPPEPRRARLEEKKLRAPPPPKEEDRRARAWRREERRWWLWWWRRVRVLMGRRGLLKELRPEREVDDVRPVGEVDGAERHGAQICSGRRRPAAKGEPANDGREISDLRLCRRVHCRENRGAAAVLPLALPPP